MSLRLQKLCLGFTSFRPETLPFAEKIMSNFEAVVLEEPQNPGFQEMLEEEMSIDDYLMLSDFEFIEFSRRSCQLMRRLYKKGQTLLQVDPYMDELIRIHEFFASEGTPDQIKSGTITREVYNCERIWTSKLINFYKESKNNDFDKIVSSVKEFAQIDAQKGILRNSMRVDRLEDLFNTYSSIYVEAGYIHLVLMKELLSRLPKQVQFIPVYIMEPVCRSLTGKKQVLAPGDILTFIYTFHSKNYQDPETDLLAAQSLIYNKILHKQEIVSNLEEYPHMKDEIKTINLVNSLSYEQCKEIYYKIRSLKTDKAKFFVQSWHSSQS